MELHLSLARRQLVQALLFLAAFAAASLPSFTMFCKSVALFESFAEGIVVTSGSPPVVDAIAILKF